MVFPMRQPEEPVANMRGLIEAEAEYVLLVVSLKVAEVGREGRKRDIERYEALSIFLWRCVIVRQR